jgi:uncharacterized membrane protein YhiD involved in acid resistance
MFEGFELGVGGAPSLSALLIHLAIGVGLALVLRWHFRTFGSTLSNRDEFAQVFPMILLTTIVVITVVKTSLALSLGLVGALSIVRFRTPVKEPEELAYLFLAIALGLGLGADQTAITVVSGLGILGVMALFGVIRRDRRSKNLFLALDWKQADPESADLVQRLTSIIGKHAASTDLRRFDVRDGSVEATLFIDLPSSQKLMDLSAELQQAFPEIGMSFIDQSKMPSI